MRSNDTTMPSVDAGCTRPTGRCRDPRAVTGTPCSSASREDRGDLVGGRRAHDRGGHGRRGGERLVVGVVVVDVLAGQHVLGADRSLQRPDDLVDIGHRQHPNRARGGGGPGNLGRWPAPFELRSPARTATSSPLRALEPGRRHVPDRPAAGGPRHHPRPGRLRQRHARRPAAVAALRPPGRRARRPARPAPDDAAGVDRPRRCSSASSAWWSPQGWEELWILYVVAFALGMGETLFDTAAQSMLPGIVDDPDGLARANGRLYAVELTANQFVGPPLGGLLASASPSPPPSPPAPAPTCSPPWRSSPCVGALPARAHRPAHRRIRTDIAEGLRYLVGHRVLRTLAHLRRHLQPRRRRRSSRSSRSTPSTRARWASARPASGSS